MTRDEVTQAIRDADARIERLRPRLRQAPETPLLSGEWRVRDALSHVAARGNAVPALQRLIERSRQEGAAAAPLPDIHEVNAGQVRDRSSNSVDELLDETVAGHRLTLESLPNYDDDTLAQRIKISFPPGELSVAELLVRAGVGHETNHLNDVEAALEAGGT